MDNLNEIFIKSYLGEYQEKEKQRINHSNGDRDIARRKKTELQGMENFLQKFVDLEIYVHHSDQYTKNSITNDTRDPQKFSFYFVDSSKKWSPGISILFDHPAEVEIAIPNKPEEEGVIVIKVASHHPYSYLIEQKFHNFESAYEALGRFLGRSTFKIGKDPRKYLKDIQPTSSTSIKKSTPQDYDFTQHTPNFPPEDEIIKKDNPLKKIGEFFQINKNKNTDNIDD